MMPEAIEKRVVGSAVGVVEDARLDLPSPLQALGSPPKLGA